MINILAVIVCGIGAMAFGSFWFGPLFGKKYMELAGQASLSPEEQASMKKKMMPMYVTSTILTIVMIYTLAKFIGGSSDWLGTSLWILVGFRLTQLAGEKLWSNVSGKKQFQMFLIQGGYQLVVFIVLGYILSIWK